MVDGTAEDAITADQLRSIIEESPAQLLADSSPKLHDLASFVNKYGRCAFNKELLMKRVMDDQKSVFCGDPEMERKNDFLSLSDFLTKTDLGFTAFQFVNSYPDWMKKRGRMSRDVRYGCSSEFTSHRGGRKSGGHATSQEGMDFYDKAVAFFGDLKSDVNYDLFRRICNAKSKSYGLLPVLKESDNVDVVSRDDSEEGEEDGQGIIDVPLFNVGHDELCEGIEGYAV